MHLLELLLNPDLLAYAVAFVTGGGLWKLVEAAIAWRKADQEEEASDAQVAADLRDELRQELQQLRERVESCESDLQAERELRMKAELKAAQLEIRVMELQATINRLRQRLGEVEEEDTDYQPFS